MNMFYNMQIPFSNMTVSGMAPMSNMESNMPVYSGPKQMSYRNNAGYTGLSLPSEMQPMPAFTLGHRKNMNK